MKSFYSRLLNVENDIDRKIISIIRDASSSKYQSVNIINNEAC